MKRMLLLFTFLFGVLAFLASSVSVLAQPLQNENVLQAMPTPSDNDVNSVAKQMYCPVCENTPLDVCPTTACAEWRELIRQKLGEGWSEAQIKEYFNLQYGDRVLAEPPPRGLNWLMYLLPPLVILLAAGILFGAVRRMRTTAAGRSTTAGPVKDPAESRSSADDPYLAQLEEELRNRKE